MTVSDSMWKSLAKYYISFLANKHVDMIEDLADFHSEKVDPREVTVSTGYFAKMVDEAAFKECPCLRHYLIATQCSKQKVLNQSTGPAIGNLLELDMIQAFARKADLVTQTEKTIGTLRAKYLPISDGGPRQASRSLRDDCVHCPSHQGPAWQASA